MDLLLAKLLFTLHLASDSSDPHALFSVKNNFAEAFRETVCNGEGQCSACSLQSSCPYHAVFARELATDPIAVKRFQKPSLPFVFHIPVLPAKLTRGAEVELGLVLVGNTLKYVPEYCAALLKLFEADSTKKSFPASIVRIESVGCSGFRNLLMANGGTVAADALVTISLEDLVAMNMLPSDQICMRIITPLKIQVEGRPVREFSFSLLIRSLLRRISSHAYYYYGTVLDLDYKRLAHDSADVFIEENRACWVEWRKGRTCGLTGTVILQGDLTDFHPVLLLGEMLQCGKDAAYGLGRFELDRLKP